MGADGLNPCEPLRAAAQQVLNDCVALLKQRIDENAHHHLVSVSHTPDVLIHVNALAVESAKAETVHHVVVETLHVDLLPVWRR